MKSPAPVQLTPQDKLKLAAVHPALEELVLECAEDCPVSFTVFEGVRTKARQRQYVAKGVSKTMNSYHLVGLAVDLVPMLPDPKAKQTLKDPMNPKLVPTWDVDSCRLIALAMSQAYARLMKPGAALTKTTTPTAPPVPTIPYTWGGSWKWFDGPHFQLDLPRNIRSSPRTAAFIKNGYRVGTYEAPVVRALPIQSTRTTKNSVIQVAEIQDKVNKILSRAQYKKYKTLEVDGVYGANTEHGVNTVQIYLNVQADGIWGPTTDKAYNRWMQAYDRASTHPSNNTIGYVNEDVKFNAYGTSARSTNDEEQATLLSNGATHLPNLNARASLLAQNDKPELTQGSNIMTGYKTYIVALCAVVGAIGSYFAGEATLVEAIQLTVTALLGATLRSGISTATTGAFENVLKK